jgi:putative transcription antitermination factor YqgF
MDTIFANSFQGWIFINELGGLLRINMVYFLMELKNRFQLPVFPIDERLTTVEARSRLFALGGYKALKKKSIDSIAAQLIVEIWLENR